ncbi:MAG: protein kinase [Gemmatimonadota bacterium]
MIDPAGRLAASLADRYRIERELGAGGMATVYLAQDLRHDRKVAVKVLRPELAAVIGAERFLSEIKTTANLQHPHILPLFDSGAADSFLFYVMPFIEGESLRDRLNREKQLPISDAVRIATEVAGALDYAHRHGVIHRDIKPENVLLHDGRALVADFGIALAASKAGGSRMTETGMSLGTPHYMSPEQAMGEREITARSDVYSLGAVTYEMLAGEPPFTGSTAQAIVARVVTETPRALTMQRHTIPPYLEAAVFTALEKLPADRFESAAEFAAALEDGGRPGRHYGRKAAGLMPPGAGVRPLTMIFAALVLLLALAAGWFLRGWKIPAQSGAPVQFAFRVGQPGRDRAFVDISPDGRRVLQAVQDSGGVNRIVIRELGSTTLTPVPGTEGASDPVFSPDGQWIAFVADGKLRKVPVGGGPSVLLADSVNAGAGWGLDGSLLYTLSGNGLWRVPASGGASERLTTLDTVRKEFNHWYPQDLPGSRAAIFNSYSTPFARSRIEAVEFATGRRTVLVEGAVFGRYVASGHLLFVRDGAIFAVRFNPSTLKLTGSPVPVMDDVAWSAPDGVAGYAVSQNGTLVYLKASEWNVDRRVVWVDRGGSERPAIPEPGPWAEPRLSPDGRWIVLTGLEPKREVWLFEVGRRILTQLTRTQGAAFNAVWMPDSRSIIYTVEDPVYDLHRIPIDASTPDAPLVASKNDKMASSVSPDGRTVAYLEVMDPDRLMLAPLDGGVPTSFEARETSQRNGMFSPDGRWLAYEGLGVSGEPNVYLRALEGSGGRRQVSADGGSQPRWTRGGREIVYRKGDATMAVSVQPETGEVGTPTLLFRFAGVGQLGATRTFGYDVTPDGSRFLMVAPVERPGAQPSVVVLDWFEELRAKVPQ